MIKKVFWNKRATTSLQASYDFILQVSPTKADDFINSVDHLIELLKRFPEIGRRSEKYKPVRQCKIDKYRNIYYRTDGDVLIIVYFHDTIMKDDMK